jgi:hypothetical protein
MEVIYVHEMHDWLKARAAQTVYLNIGVNSDSGLSTDCSAPEDKYLQEIGA